MGTLRIAGTERDVRYRRGKKVCHLVEVVRTDGFVLRLTDHDRTIDYGGEKFEPIVLAGFSADRREAAFRSGDQQASGIIDGDKVTIPDLRGNLYRGAEVRQIVTHWDRPWAIIGRHRKWIRSLTWTGSAFTGTLEGRSQEMQRSRGGPLSGTWATTCTHTLGDPSTCRKDISVGSGFAGAGARAQTIVTPRAKVQFYLDTWPGDFDDGYFRDGSLEWMWAVEDESGQVTAMTSDNVVEDTGAAWTVDEHVGKWVRILTGAGEGVDGTAYAKIIANTVTQLIYLDNLGMAGFAIGSDYDICPEAVNFGVVSPIVYYTHATRECTFLTRTPFAITAGDSGIWRAGCDGLLGTCFSKFDNKDNHGGDPHAPSAQQVVEPPEEA